jgi:hypothetical protein
LGIGPAVKSPATCREIPVFATRTAVTPWQGLQFYVTGVRVLAATGWLPSTVMLPSAAIVTT